jgi:hypothetical protein
MIHAHCKIFAFFACPAHVSGRKTFIKDIPPEQNPDVLPMKR